MRNENISITISDVWGIGFLSFGFEYHRENKFSLERMKEEGVRDIASPVVESFIQSFPYRQISQIEYRMKVIRPHYQKTDVVNIQADTFFHLEDDFRFVRTGYWFVCSECPLELSFEKHNELLGCGARIPFSNWRGRFSRWAAKVLQSSRATCFGGVDEDCLEVWVCFWPVDLEVVESHLGPILNKYGLGISKPGS